MKPPRTSCRARFILLFAGLFLRAPLAAGEPPPLPPQPHLTSDARSRLAEAARNSTLAPWQQEFMLEVARHRAQGTASQSSPALPSVVLRSDRIAADDGIWTAVPPPSARYGHTAVYDSVRDRMVVFGGWDGGPRNDVWVLSLAGSPAWSELAPAGSLPLARYAHTAIYDPVRDRMVVFGGWNGSARNDVWALSLAGSPAWSALAPAGSPPSARYFHSAIYDPVRDRMVVFGGIGAGLGGGLGNNVWALSLAGSPAWSELAPTGSLPSARYAHTAIYDPVSDRMVVFGGSDGSPRNDVWALALAGSPVWSELAPAGTLPSARYQHTAFYDPVRDRMVVFGGRDGGYRDDVWALALEGSPAWSALAPAGSLPSARYGHTAFYDPVGDRMVVFGGWDGGYRNDVWALSLAESPAWSALAPAATPSARYSHTAIYDPVRDRMVVFGGWDGNYRNDVWALSLAGSPAWSALAPAGSPPSARYGHTAFYDPVRDRMVVFGGYDDFRRNDVWALSLAGSPAWSALAPTGTPPLGRWGHTASYDPVRDRMVVFGGNGDGGLLGDAWALSLAGSPAWSALAPAGSPPSARYGHTAIYDPVGDRMVVFAGYDGSLLNDVWALALAGSPAWSALATAGSPPAARYAQTAFYDPVRDRMVVFGGFAGPFRNDVWALALAGSPVWSALAPGGTLPSARYFHTAPYDPVRDRMVVFGGENDSPLNDVWMLVWGTPVAVPGDADAILRGFELAPPRPNPSRGETFVDFVLRAPARVVLDVFDAHGRRVRRIADDWFPAGRHASTWRGDDDRGRALASGVYFIRMHGGGFQATRRTVRIR